MKTKTKKEMNLPQLIEYAWEYGLKGITFYSINGDRGVDYEASFDEDGNFYSNDEINPELIFEVETEEEITEDTVIPKLLVKFKSPSRYQVFSNDYINSFEVEEGNIEAFYILNDDLTLTLIWTKEKGLVD
uniref:Uncharacterized protein n=1 Tax=Mammaliicoccus phage MSShimriz1 TaxID=3230127 RepID=A0AAU8GSZ3_9VIRU